MRQNLHEAPHQQTSSPKRRVGPVYILLCCIFTARTSGSQKDRHRGTSGAKEGFSSIGRLGKKQLNWNILAPFDAILKY